jgi:hypothetical protein
MITYFLASLVALSLATLAWWKWSRRDARPRFTPPGTPTREDAVYMGEIQPRQRELVLAAYRYVTGNAAPDTRPLGYQEILSDGTVRGWTPEQLGPILPLSVSLCAGCRQLGWTQLLSSVSAELLIVLPEEHRESFMVRLAQLPHDHAAAIEKMSGNPEYLKLIYGLGEIPSAKPSLRTYSRKG